MAASSKGICYLCGADLGKVAMKNHILKVHGEKNGGQECRLLKIEGAYDKNYWLMIDVPVEKSLSDIDKFLRKIWLECCGHMSAFSGPGHRKIGKSQRLNVFASGDQLLHEYDFGSTTETVLTFVGSIRRSPRKQAVRLLARNIPPKFQCARCGLTAEYICTECIYDSGNPFYCAVCAEEHEHEMLLPVTNSPRMGVCGYDGELDTYSFVLPKTESGGEKA